MELKWADHLSVGNAMIDSDHKNLIVVVNRVNGAIKARNRAALSAAVELLDTYMLIHTQNEEKIAASVNYPFAQDKLAQLQLMAEMKYMINKLEAVYGVWPDNLLNMYSRYLNDWISGHIINTNMKMKPALKAYPYDFIPNRSPDSNSLQTAMILPIGSYIDPRPPIW